MPSAKKTPTKQNKNKNPKKKTSEANAIIIPSLSLTQLQSPL